MIFSDLESTPKMKDQDSQQIVQDRYKLLAYCVLSRL